MRALPNSLVMVWAGSSPRLFPSAGGVPLVPAPCVATAPVPPPAYQQAVARRGRDLHSSALTLVTTSQLLALCECAVTVAQRRCPPASSQGPGGAPIVYPAASLLLLALLRTLWRRSHQDTHDWLVAWPALAACGLPRAGCASPAHCSSPSPCGGGSVVVGTSSATAPPLWPGSKTTRMRRSVTLPPNAYSPWRSSATPSVPAWCASMPPTGDWPSFAGSTPS